MQCKMTLVALALASAYPAMAQVGQERTPGRQDHAAAQAADAATTSRQSCTDGAGRYEPVLKNGEGLSPGNCNLPGASPRALDTKSALVGDIRMEIDRDGIPADGQSPAKVILKLFDLKGQPLTGEQFVTVEISGGRIQLPGASTDEAGPGRRDADRVIPGTQIRAVNGQAEFLLLAPDTPQDVAIRVTAGYAEVRGTVSYVPELRDMIAVGLVEGIINVRHFDQSQLQAARTNDGFEYEMQRWAREWDNGKRSAAVRTAFFLKGKIKGEYLLTMAFDSDKETRNRLFRDIRPDEFYPVYGDSSIVGFDARSSDRLYLRVDKNKSYLLYGDFTTGAGFTQRTGGGQTAPLALRQLGNYSRSVTGLKHHYESEKATTNLFALYDSLNQVVDELPGRGVSGPYAVSNSNGIQNTEKVELLVRDRNQPNVILSVTPLVRFSDYVFEPFSGQLLFTRPIPTVDANLNPVSIRITYEVDQGGEKYWSGGIDGQFRLGRNFEVGGSYVKEDNPQSPYSLGSANASVRLGEKTVLLAEVARTDGTANTNGVNPFHVPSPSAPDPVGDISGQAARIELRHQGERLEGRAYAVKVDDTFDNPASGYVPGRNEAGLKFSGKVSESTRLYAEAFHSQDRANDARRDAQQLGVQHHFNEKLEIDVGVKHVEEDGAVGLTFSPGANTIPGIGSPNGGFYNSGATAIDPMTGQPIINGQPYNPALNPNAVPQNTTSLRGRLTWRPDDRWALYGELERDIDDSDKKRAALGADYRFAERSKVYARAESQSGMASYYSLDPSEKSNAFIVGVDAGYGEEGQAFSEYRLRDAIGGREAQAASGIRNTWNIAEGLRLQAGVERLKILSGDAQSSTALSFGLEYTGHPLWKSSGRIEWRKLDESETLTGNQAWLSTVMLARKLSRDWTFLGRNYFYMLDHKNGGEQLQNRLQLGVAYRDTDTNRVNALARYEYKVERDATQSDVESRKVHIFSTHADYHPHRQWWMTGRLAGKYVDEKFDGIADNYSATLLSGRVTYDINDRWDIGAMAASLYSPKGNSTQWATGVEAGYLIKQNLWISLGYNWKGFHDRDLTASEYTSQGIYLRLRFKFDETLFDGFGRK